MNRASRVSQPAQHGTAQPAHCLFETMPVVRSVAAPVVDHGRRSSSSAMWTGEKRRRTIIGVSSPRPLGLGASSDDGDTADAMLMDDDSDNLIYLLSVHLTITRLKEGSLNWDDTTAAVPPASDYPDEDVDEYYDWEKYHLIFSCYETDEAYVKYWDQLTKQMKWVEDALLLGHKQFSTKYDDRGGRQAVKIAAGFCHLPASLATLGYEEYVLALQYDLDCRKDYDLVYFEVWRRISKQEMSFEEALKDILSSQNKLSSSCLFRIQAELKGCGLMRRDYSICMDVIQKLVANGGEGAVSKKHFTVAVYSKIPIPKMYVDYAKKKLEVARRIHLMPGMGLPRRIENGQSDSENGTVH